MGNRVPSTVTRPLGNVGTDLRFSRARLRALEAVRRRPGAARRSNRTDLKTGQVNWQSAAWLVVARLVIEVDGRLYPTDRGSEGGVVSIREPRELDPRGGPPAA